jgi:predicted DNA-binding transcriptional regulator YafY
LRRTDRLFELLQIFRGGRLYRGVDLAETLGISLRTLYRDIDTLIQSGIPIEAERGVGYILRQPIFLPPLTLTASELEALHFGMDLARRAADKDLANAAGTLLSKIDAVLPTGAPRQNHAWAFAVYTPTMADANRCLAQLRDAILAQRYVRIDYNALNGIKSERRIRALQVEFWGQVWTCTAWCETRQDFRVFRVDRIISCTIEAECYASEPDKSLEQFIELLDPLIAIAHRRL